MNCLSINGGLAVDLSLTVDLLWIVCRFTMNSLSIYRGLPVDLSWITLIACRFIVDCRRFTMDFLSIYHGFPVDRFIGYFLSNYHELSVDLSWMACRFLLVGCRHTTNFLSINHEFSIDLSWSACSFNASCLSINHGCLVDFPRTVCQVITVEDFPWSDQEIRSFTNSHVTMPHVFKALEILFEQR